MMFDVLIPCLVMRYSLQLPLVPFCSPHVWEL